MRQLPNQLSQGCALYEKAPTKSQTGTNLRKRLFEKLVLRLIYRVGSGFLTCLVLLIKTR
jgi:hypothetical protein